MRFYLSTLCCLSFFFHGYCQLPPKTHLFDEERPQKLNILKSSPFPLLISQIPITGEIRLAYERVLGPYQSTMVSLSYIYPNFIFADTLRSINQVYNTNYRMRGIRAQANYRYWLLKNWLAPEGIYIGPLASYNVAKVNEPGYGEEWVKVIYWNVNLIFGFQFLARDKMAFDFYTGFGYRHNYLLTKEIGNPVDYDRINRGLKLVMSFNMGIAFNKQR